MRLFAWLLTGLLGASAMAQPQLMASRTVAAVDASIIRMGVGANHVFVGYRRPTSSWVQCFNPIGVLLWEKKVQDTTFEQFVDLRVDAEGHLLVLNADSQQSRLYRLDRQTGQKLVGAVIFSGQALGLETRGNSVAVVTANAAFRYSVSTLALQSSALRTEVPDITSFRGVALDPLNQLVVDGIRQNGNRVTMLRFRNNGTLLGRGESPLDNSHMVANRTWISATSLAYSLRFNNITPNSFTYLLTQGTVLTDPDARHGYAAFGSEVAAFGAQRGKPYVSMRRGSSTRISNNLEGDLDKAVHGVYDAQGLLRVVSHNDNGRLWLTSYRYDVTNRDGSLRASGVAIFPTPAYATAIGVDGNANVHALVKEGGMNRLYRFREKSQPIADRYEIPGGRMFETTAANGVLVNDFGTFNGSSGNPLTIVTPPANGVVNLASNGAFQYIPDAGFTGMDSFRYRLTRNDSGEANVTLVVRPRMLSVTTAATHGSGSFATVTGTLNGNAVSPAPVSLVTSTGYSTGFTIPVGQSSGSKPVLMPQVTTPTQVTITGSYDGSSATTTTTALPLDLQSIVLLNNPVVGGNASTLRIMLNGLSTGLTLNLSSNFAGITIPATVTVPSGESQVDVPVGTGMVTSALTRTITVSGPTKSMSVNLTMEPGGLRYFTLASTSVTGGNPVTATLTLSGTVAYAQNVNLLSSSNNATVPAQVSIPANTLSQTFTVTTLPVAVTTSATLTAEYGVIERTQTLTVQP